MQSKFCTRCQFRVPGKSKVCPICGCRNFEAMHEPVIEPVPANQSAQLHVNASNSIRDVLHSFAEDLATTAEKSGRAWNKMVRLIRGT